MLDKPTIKHLVILIVIVATLPLRAALPGADTLAGLMTKQFDANGDKSIDQTEWQSGLEQSFHEMDTAGDGSLSGADLDALAKPLGEEIGDFTAGLLTPLIKKMVLTMDTDKDGSVSLKEYIAQATALFAKLDTNKNGILEQTELLELPTKLVGG